MVIPSCDPPGPLTREVGNWDYDVLIGTKEIESHQNFYSCFVLGQPSVAGVLAVVRFHLSFILRL